jgi:hypothetical protein
MVHALEEIRRLLRPGGRLIDVHPRAESSSIEVHQAGNIELAGHLAVRRWCADYEAAEKALAEISQRGLFKIEQERRFDALTHYGSAQELREAQLADLQAYGGDSESVDPAASLVEELATRADEMMSAAVSDAEIILRERAHMRRLRPL